MDSGMESGKHMGTDMDLGSGMVKDSTHRVATSSLMAGSRTIASSLKSGGRVTMSLKPGGAVKISSLQSGSRVRKSS